MVIQNEIMGRSVGGRVEEAYLGKVGDGKGELRRGIHLSTRLHHPLYARSFEASL